jgi:hypothetical protein
MANSADSADQPTQSDEDSYPAPEPFNEELVEVLQETCKSYQSFLRAFVKSQAKNRADGVSESSALATEPLAIG